MTLSANRIMQYLDGQEVPHECRRHPRDVTAEQAARDSHASPGQFAKAIAVNADGSPMLAVLPADHHIDLAKLKAHLGASLVEILPEEDLAKFFPDCEVGAVPALGNLYGMPICISSVLTKEQMIVFHAGTHEEVIEMPYASYEHLAKPTVADFSSPKA